MRYVFLPILLAALFAGPQARSADAPTPSFELTLKNHAFVPPQLTIPAGAKIRLTVRNLDPTPAEFESDDFQAEKVVPAAGEISLYIAPLKAGTYGFFDDFHEDQAKGTLIVR